MTMRYKPAQVPEELHEWLRTEAFMRRTTITAEIAEAVALLRDIRTAEAAKTTAAPQRGPLVQA